MPKPIAVLISDVHYSLPTLQLADAAMRQAIAKANSLGVPLIICGDLHDTKANLRGECVNAMIETFKLCSQTPYILVGNHDKINEKSTEHSLNFLSHNCVVVSSLCSFPKRKDIYLLPYYYDSTALIADLKKIPKGSTLIMHQGIEGSNSGDYIQDKSAINPQDVAGMRVISGHYHTRQTIKLPDGGIWDYIGNPYTLNYAEANDPPKGFQVLMDDGSLEFVPTNLREHRILEYTVEELKGEAIFLGDDHDLVWVKITDTKENLARVTKAQVAIDLDINQPFRLDLIPTDSKTQTPDSRLNLSQGPLFDSLIDSLGNTSNEQKHRLKQTWKSLCE